MSLYHKATVDGVEFATVRHCAADKAKNCVMMVKHDDTGISFGQVQDFVSTFPPGTHPGAEDSKCWECYVVRLKWYKRRANDRGTNLPVLEKGPLRENHPHGDLWDMHYVNPAPIGVLPHWRDGRLHVVVSERSTFSR